MGKGTYIEKIIHDKAKGGCGGHTLGVFLQDDGSYNGWCYSCSTFVKTPYADYGKNYTPPKPRLKTPEEIQEELQEIHKHPVRDLPERKLGKGTLQHFGVKVGLSQENGTDVVAHYYPYTIKDKVVGYQVRKVLDKKFFKLGETHGLEPFGWQQAIKSATPKLFITEGEIDCMSLFKILVTHSKYDEPPAVISLPSGASSTKNMAPFIQGIRNKFKDVVLVFDTDNAGQLAVENFLKLMPEAKIATLPLKDANDMLVAGRDKECFNICMWQAKQRLSGKMISSSTLWDKARERPEMGVAWPWDSLTEYTRGIRTKEGYYLGGGTKIGKSTFVNAIVENFIVKHGETVFVCKPEESPVVTARKVAGYTAGAIFDDPKIEFDEDAFLRGSAAIGDKLILYDSYQKTEWKDVKEAIRSAVVSHGCKRVVVDPITCFSVGVSAGERNELLVEIASEIAAMSMELDFTYFIFCHLNKPDSGPPHERGGKVQSVQFAGSRAMMR